MANKPQLNLRPQDGTSWENLYSIDVDDLTNATRENFFVMICTGEGHRHVNATYIGADALTIAEFNAFEIGSTIMAPAIATPAIYLKTAATTWKLQAINT